MTGVFKFNPASAIRALELLGRELGLFAERETKEVWNGDPSQLSSEQFANLTACLERIANEGGAEPESGLGVAAQPDKPPIQ